MAKTFVHFEDEVLESLARKCHEKVMSLTIESTVMGEELMIIGIGSDHGGYALKEKIKIFLSENRYEYKDLGTGSLDSCDYPDFGETVGKCVSSGKCARGIVICTTGIGISIAANKIKGIRAALCRDIDSAVMTRKHNDANVLALGAKYTDGTLAKKIVKAFLETDFDGAKPDGERHKKRVDKIRAIEEKNFR